MRLSGGKQGKWAEEGRQGQNLCQGGPCTPSLYPRLEEASVGSVSLSQPVPHEPQGRVQHGLQFRKPWGGRICTAGDARSRLLWG